MTTLMIMYISGSIKFRNICITSKKKVRLVYKLDAIIGELKVEIKIFWVILKLYGLDAYIHYPFVVNNMNYCSLGTLRSKLGKEEAKKSSEEFRAYIIGKSESNISIINLLNDKDKENQDKLQNKIKQLNSEENMRSEKLKKEIIRLNKEVLELDSLLHQLTYTTIPQRTITLLH